MNPRETVCSSPMFLTTYRNSLYKGMYGLMNEYLFYTCTGILSEFDWWNFSNRTDKLTVYILSTWHDSGYGLI